MSDTSYQPTAAGEQKETLELLIEQHTSDPENLVVLSNLGVACFNAGLYTEAADWFQKLAVQVERINPQTFDNSVVSTIYQNLYQSALLSGQQDMARKVLLKLRAVDPENNLVSNNMEKIALARLHSILLEAEQDMQSFITYHRRPVHCSSYGLSSDALPKEKIAIVIQGPLLTYEDFTLETVKLYRKIFPFCELFISTWNDEDSQQIERIKNAGAQIVLNEKPVQCGFGNINMQIRSASNGIIAAKQTGSIYVLKTRTDNRIYNPLFFVDALNLQNVFPLSTEMQLIQNKRLVAFSDYNRYLLYAVQDRNMFGHMDDMEKYWSPPEDNRTSCGELETQLQFAQFGYAESYLFTRYMSRIGRELKWSLTDFWYILKEHFVIMDEPSADVYWCKHVRNLEFRFKQYFHNYNTQLFSFLDWLRLYHGDYPMLDDPRIISRKQGAYISDILKEHLDGTKFRV